MTLIPATSPGHTRRLSDTVITRDAIALVGGSVMTYAPLPIFFTAIVQPTAKIGIGA